MAKHIVSSQYDATITRCRVTASDWGRLFWYHECKQVVGTSSWGSILRVSHLSHHTRTHQKIAFAMSVIAKVGEFLNTLTMQYELRYKWWINAGVMILSVPHCLCWSFYFQNIITFLFEKLSCAVEIFIWSDAVDFLIKLLGMPYSVVTAQQACSTEIVFQGLRFCFYIPTFSTVRISNNVFIHSILRNWPN